MAKTLNMIRKLILAILFVIVFFVLFVQFSWNKKFKAPYPDIKASTDSMVIERGKYLAYGPAHCGTCHVPMDKITEVENGSLMPLVGGWEFSILPGVFRAPNLTPDKETGIGNLSDAEIARTLRYMVGSDDRCIAPFMPFAELSTEDLIAIVSFLKSQAPIRHSVKRSEFTFLGKALMAMNFIQPEGIKGNPIPSIKVDSTSEYGKYLANSVANCVGCHTNRDLKTGKFIGKPFAGGFQFEPDAFSEGMTFVSPNLTPDVKTGIMAEWDENMFIKRFRSGRLYKGSPMPWGSFGRMTDTDLKALYRYLHTLDPVENKIEKVIFDPKIETSDH